MSRSRRWLSVVLVLFLLSSLFLSNPTVPTVSALSQGHVLINEIVPAPQATFTQEKIELYNTTANPIDIGGLWIDDLAGGGGAPRQIPIGTTIPAHGFYVHSDAGFLNNSGDEVRLLETDGVTVLDLYTYSASPGYDAAYGRLCDGGAWAGSANPTPTIGATNGACQGQWTPGTFAIYVFDVEQGDSQLIVSPTGNTLLIDVNEASWNTGAGVALIADKLHQIMGPSFNHLDYIVASHLHLDHIGYAGYGGIWGLIETHGFTVGKLIDRDAGTWVDSNGDGACNPDTEIVWSNAGTFSGTARHWLCYVTDPANASKLNREIAAVGSTTQIDLGPDVTVLVAQRDAENVLQVDGVTPVRGDHTAEAVPPSENDYSIGLKVTYGALDYVTAGDTDGEYTTSDFNYTYNDVERILAQRLGLVEVLHVNHHGSSHSTNQVYVDTLQPAVALISCGDNSYGHPAQTTLDRLFAAGAAIYLTNLCDTTRNYGASVIVNGDIIIESSDGLHYAVNGTSYTATNPVTPTPTATPTNTPTPTTTPTNTPTPTPTPTAVPQSMTFTSIAAEDGYIQESSETSNKGGTAYGTGTTVRAGDDASDRQWLAILSFDTTMLPDNAVIQSVEVRLQRSGVTGLSPFDTHGALWVDVINGVYGGSATFAKGDFEAASTAVQVASLSNPTANGQWATGLFNSAGHAAVNKTGRTQVKVHFNLDDNDDLSNDYMGFQAGEATAASRPALIVTYTLP
ncbi:ComE operon protein 3 [Thermoflexales bacterium]|nr:ComE operon protein 3 [Thermoflexales bacterium]